MRLFLFVKNLDIIQELLKDLVKIVFVCKQV